jgi:DNA-binding IclR family transcriptional regulator
MTLSEVARRVEVTPAAARRSLITLMELGYVGQTGKRFHLKPRIMALGSAFYFAARVDELLQPDLRRIVERFGDASSVGTLDGQDVIYIAHVSVQRARRASAVAGARYPAFATSIGRVILSGLPDDRLDAWLDTRWRRSRSPRAPAPTRRACATRSWPRARRATPPRSTSSTTGSPRWPCRSATPTGARSRRSTPRATRAWSRPKASWPTACPNCAGGSQEHRP